MRLEVANMIVEAAYELGVELRKYDNYSGRGMFGEETVGVIGDPVDMLKAVALAGGRAAQSDGDMLDTLIEGLDLRSDNYGRSDLIWY